jgi:hypothetical protein
LEIGKRRRRMRERKRTFVDVAGVRLLEALELFVDLDLVGSEVPLLCMLQDNER